MDGNDNNVVVYALNPKFKKLKKVVQITALNTLKQLRKNNCSLEIFLVTNRNIQKINAQYRNKNTVTNILSFTYPYFIRPDLKSKKFLGEIYLAPDFIQKQKQEIGFLIVHGILHLLGYTHFTLKNSIIMKKQENKIWSALKTKV